MSSSLNQQFQEKIESGGGEQRRETEAERGRRDIEKACPLGAVLTRT